MNWRGLSAAVLGFLVVLVALAVCVLSWDSDPSVRMLFFAVAVVVAVPSTLAAIGSVIGAGRAATTLLRVAGGLFALVGVLLLPLLVSAVLCFCGTWPGAPSGVLLLLVAGTVFLVGGALAAHLFVAPNAGGACLNYGRLREPMSIEAGWGWWPPGLRCTYTDNLTGVRTVVAPEGYWPVGLGLLSIGSFAGGTGLHFRTRKQERAVQPF